jgi:hypothetical protein
VADVHPESQSWRRGRLGRLIWRLGAFLAAVGVASIGLAGAGLLLLSAFLDGLVYEDGSRVYGWLPGYVAFFLGLSLVGLASHVAERLSSVCEDLGFDPVDDLCVVGVIVWYGGLAVGAVAIAVAIL